MIQTHDRNHFHDPLGTLKEAFPFIRRLCYLYNELQTIYQSCLIRVDLLEKCMNL